MYDVTALTYDEIAERLGIERESARQLVIRRRWQRRKGNDGKARIEVPNEALPAAPTPDTSTSTSVEPVNATVDAPSESEEITRVFTRHIERLEQAIATSQERAGRLEIERDAARDVARDSERDRDMAKEAERALTARIEALQSTLEAEKTLTALERDRAAELKADRDKWAEQATRSLWRRLVG